MRILLSHFLSFDELFILLSYRNFPKNDVFLSKKIRQNDLEKNSAGFFQKCRSLTKFLKISAKSDVFFFAKCSSFHSHAFSAFQPSGREGRERECFPMVFDLRMFVKIFLSEKREAGIC